MAVLRQVEIAEICFDLDALCVCRKLAGYANFRGFGQRFEVIWMPCPSVGNKVAEICFDLFALCVFRINSSINFGIFGCLAQ